MEDTMLSASAASSGGGGGVMMMSSVMANVGRCGSFVGHGGVLFSG
jgi:hypothetical protein